MRPAFLRLAFVLLLLLVACGGPSSGPERVGTSTSAIVTATGVDYSWARPSPSGLKADGYTFAARYLSYDTTGKNLSASEADALWAAGVDVVANWEESATAALNGFSQGASDAAAANSQAQADGIPDGRPIYFSVDFDATPGDQTAIDAYFDGVASVIGLARTGAYGGYYVIQRLFNDGKITWGWQTYAWSGGQWDPRAQLQQVQNDITAAGDGSCCDKDQAVQNDFGQWHANTPPRGYLDSAACDAIAGWAQDQDAPSQAIFVDLYFNGAAGASGAEGMRITAGNSRSDLCTAIMSCDHGFSIPVPVGMLDGQSHPVYAYGIDTAGGANTLLVGSPKSIACPNAKPPLDAHSGVKRHVVDPTSMTDWGFSSLTDVAPEPKAVVDDFPEGADWPEKPELVQADDGTPEVWLIDGKTRRHVISPDSLTAWHRSFTEVVKTPAAQVYAYKKGPDLPATPFLLKDSDPAVWVLDVSTDGSSLPPGTAPGADAGDADAATLDADEGADARSSTPHGKGGPEQAGGCSVRGTPGTSGGSGFVGTLPLLFLVGLRRRRPR